MGRQRQKFELRIADTSSWFPLYLYATILGETHEAVEIHRALEQAGFDGGVYVAIIRDAVLRSIPLPAPSAAPVSPQIPAEQPREPAAEAVPPVASPPLPPPVPEPEDPRKPIRDKLKVFQEILAAINNHVVTGRSLPTARIVEAVQSAVLSPGEFKAVIVPELEKWLKANDFLDGQVFLKETRVTGMFFRPGPYVGHAFAIISRDIIKLGGT